MVWDSVAVAVRHRNSRYHGHCKLCLLLPGWLQPEGTLGKKRLIFFWSCPWKTDSTDLWFSLLTSPFGLELVHRLRRLHALVTVTEALFSRAANGVALENL